MLLKNQEQTQKLRKRTFFCEMWPRGKLNGGRNYKNSAGFIFSRQVIFVIAMMPSVGEFVKRSNKLLSVKLSTFHRICEGISKIYSGTIF